MDYKGTFLKLDVKQCIPHILSIFFLKCLQIISFLWKVRPHCFSTRNLQEKEKRHRFAGPLCLKLVHTSRPEGAHTFSSLISREMNSPQIMDISSSNTLWEHLRDRCSSWIQSQLVNSWVLGQLQLHSENFYQKRLNTYLKYDQIIPFLSI